ncbi:hypothetical protein [Nocardia lasii]|uniref:Mce-associated membrane protein n=1 Tax=Nocardia lasii TaxID=1616107 RepID=A0ABW1JQA7_9NOCA
MATDETASDSTPEEKPTDSTPDPATEAVDTEKTVKVDKSAPADDAKTVVVSKTADEPAAKPAAGETESKSDRGPWIAAAAAGVAAVALGTALAVFVVLWAQRGTQIDDAKDASAAACDFARASATFDANGDLDAFFAGVEERSTGEVQSNFRDGAAGLRAAMLEVGAKSTVEELECAPLSTGDDQAVVAATWIQFQSNKISAESRSMIFPVKITIDKIDGKWLVSKVDSPILDRLGVGANVGGVPTAPEGGAPAPTPGN